jgi:hypothetical protein
MPIARGKQSSVPATLELRGDLGKKFGHNEFLSRSLCRNVVVNSSLCPVR